MNWTFGQKLAAGFAATLALTLLIGVFASWTLAQVVADKDRLITDYASRMVALQELDGLGSEMMAYNRGYLLLRAADQLEAAGRARDQFDATWARLSLGAEEQSGWQRIDQARDRYWQRTNEVIEMRRAGGSVETVSRVFDQRVVPEAQALKKALTMMSDDLSRRMDVARRQSNEMASQAIALVIGIAVLAILLAAAVAVLLTRTLNRQIGGAIGHLQSSSAELQAAASQQASGSSEQAAAMNEVSTTMKELLSTARQISESAQRVAAIAAETADSADSGEQAVSGAERAVSTIQRQVEQIVQHMVDLGRKTQQIGGVLDIIKELAEQTNILSINATIEAAGAGEHGKRFGAVAEEIRKLADRVGDSTGEVRQLIEEVRSATNTTIMATEDGSKAVEAGGRQFGELTSAFKRIVDQVGTTAEAAREIELSTKQQTTAVEQVNTAIYDAAQAAKETEASSRQTLQTSSQLADVSRELGALVRSQAAS